MRTTFIIIFFGLAISLAGCKPKEEEAATGVAPPVAQQEPSPAPPVETATAAGEGETCGGIAGITCIDGAYCATEAGQCQVADAAGTCETKTQACTREYLPVCGCDGTTYPNACSAAAAGVNVDTTGECPAAQGGGQ